MINKSKIITPADDDEIKLVLSKACDLYTKALHTTRPFYTRFLSPLESLTLNQRFPKHELNIKFFGGYDEAERQICSFYTYEEDLSFPVSALQIKVKSKNASLSHRDYMGSILSLGIKRETIGDIIITDDGAVVFCLDEITGYITDNLPKVGGTGVSVTKADSVDDLEIKRDFDEISSTVSSLRCDCVIASALNLARGKAAETIERGLVTLNYEMAKSVSQPIKDGDVISVRGSGKFKIRTDGHLTKKSRIHITVCKYK